MNTENHYQETDLGNISLNPRGEYNPEESYEYLDLVVLEGGSYVCLAENGATITGISPESGKTTQYWQVITIPGSLTPEYIAMHDSVVNLSEQVEADAEEVRTAEQNVSGMELNVTQMQEQTRQSAEAAEQSKDSSAGYAASADASRQAAEESKQNIDVQVTGFDSHVAEKTEEAENDIEAARIAANKAIIAQQEQSVNEVARAGIEAISTSQSAAQTATEKAQAADTSEKNAAASETAAKLSETNATKMAEQVAADKEQVANDRTAVENAKQEMTESVAQIEQNTQGIADLKGDLDELDERCTYLIYESDNLITDTSEWDERGIWWYQGIRYAYNDGNEYTKNTKSLKIPVNPNTTYYADDYDAVTKYRRHNTICIMYASFFDANDVYISGSGLTKISSFTPPAGTSYARLQYTFYDSSTSDVQTRIPWLSTTTPPEVYAENEYLDFTKIQNQIDELKEEKKVESDVSLFLPSAYNLVVGDTFELFYKGIINAVNTDMYYVSVSGYKGNNYSKKFVFVPTSSDVGTRKVTFKLYDLGNNLLDEKEVDFVVKAKASSPSSQKNVLLVGDSLTTAGIWCKELKRRLVGSGGSPNGDELVNINFIGTCINDDTRYEGYGGWTFASYNTANVNNTSMLITCTHDKSEISDQHSVYADENGATWKLETIYENSIKLIRTSDWGNLPTNGTLTWLSGGENHSNIVYTNATQTAGNPFWSTSQNKVDFAEYASRLGVSSIDYVYVLLGWNDAWSNENRIKSDAQTFIDNVKASFPNVKIVLIGLEIPARDGVGTNYSISDSNYSDYFKLVKYVFNLDKWYDDIVSENTNVSHIRLSGQFDTENNMMTSERPVNIRNSKTEVYQSNGVHPSEYGYLQIADACYRDFVHKLIN